MRAGRPSSSHVFWRGSWSFPHKILRWRRMLGTNFGILRIRQHKVGRSNILLGVIGEVQNDPQIALLVPYMAWVIYACIFVLYVSRYCIIHTPVAQKTMLMLLTRICHPNDYWILLARVVVGHKEFLLISLFVSIQFCLLKDGQVSRFAVDLLRRAIKYLSSWLRLSFKLSYYRRPICGRHEIQ